MIKVRALDGMRLAATLLHNMMVRAHNEMLEGGSKEAARIAAKDYLWAQREIAQYEDHKLSAVTVKGDAANPIRQVHEWDFSKLSDAELATLSALQQKIVPAIGVGQAAQTQH